MSLAQLRVSHWVNFFGIKKNVNSTKDYGFENSNDKCFCNLQWIKLSGNVLETD